MKVDPLSLAPLPTHERVDRIVRWGLFLMLCGYVLFAHGCHAGDHDNELFVRTMTSTAAERLGTGGIP